MTTQIIKSNETSHHASTKFFVHPVHTLLLNLSHDSHDYCTCIAACVTEMHIFCANDIDRDQAITNLLDCRSLYITGP